jgi:formimidoylglutamate deiminase
VSLDIGAKRDPPVSALLFDRLLTASGWREEVLIRVEAGTIQAVELDPDRLGQTAARRVHGHAFAGTGNIHSHTFQRGFAGLTERRGTTDDHFWTWRQAMYRFVARLSPDDVEAIAAMAFVEMLENGFTAVGEFHYLHHQPDGRPYANLAELSERIVAAAAETGIGLTLLPAFYGHGGFSGAPTTLGQRRFVCDRDLFTRLFEGARRAVQSLPNGQIGVAPHSLRAVTASEMLDLVTLSSHRPIHIHVAEQTKEVDDCLAATGARPVQWLLDNLNITSQWCLIHATHMDRTETKRAAKSGAVAGLCPVTECNLGDGIFPATEFVAAGGTFAVGSDSNVCISLVEELRMLEYSQRLRDRSRNRLSEPHRSTGRFLFETATKSSGQALAMNIGQIAPGFRADFVVLDDDPNFFASRDGDAILDSWIFAANRSPVRDVFIAGAPIVVDGRHRRRDRIESRWRSALGRIADR